MTDMAIPVRAPAATSADDTILPFGVAALDLRGRVVRFGDAIDVDIETLPDGWFRCWFSMQFRGTSITMNVMMGAKSALDYAGDGTSSIAIRKAALRPGARLRAEN